MTFNPSAMFADAVVSTSHGRHASKLATTSARVAAFATRDAAKVDAAHALERARVANLWLSDADARRVDDMFTAFGAVKESAARARVLWRAGGDWRHAIRDMLIARADIAAGNGVALSRGDASQRGRIMGVIGAHVTRWNRGEKNAHLRSDAVDPADVWQRAAELCIRDGATVGGMPTYGGMVARHKSAAADLRRDALAARRGYVTLSLNDDYTADMADAMAARGYVHVMAPAALYPDVETLASDAARAWFPNVDGMHDDDGRPTIAAHRAAMADAHRERGDDTRAVAMTQNVDALSRMSAFESPMMSDDARMGRPVIACIAHGMTFDEIREHYSASDATLTRYAMAYADAVSESARKSRDAAMTARVADAARRAHRADTHVCDTRAGVWCAPCTATYAWLTPMRARRIIARRAADIPARSRTMPDAGTYGCRAGRTVPADAFTRYAPMPLHVPTDYAPTNASRNRARAGARLANMRADAVMTDARKRADAVDAKRAKRIMSAAQEVARDIRACRASVI